MSESRKRLSLGKKARKTPEKPVLESTDSSDLMLNTLLEETEKKVKELKKIKELNAKKEDSEKEPEEECETKEEEKEEPSSKRPRLNLGKKKKKEEVKEAKVEAPQEEMVTESVQEAPVEAITEELIQTPQDRIMTALDGQLSAMGRLAAAADEPHLSLCKSRRLRTLRDRFATCVVCSLSMQTCLLRTLLLVVWVLVLLVPVKSDSLNWTTLILLTLPTVGLSPITRLLRSLSSQLQVVVLTSVD